MKLFQLFKRYIIVVMLAVLVVGSAAHFFIFQYFIHYSTDKILYEYKQRIVSYAQVNDTLIASSTQVIQPSRVEQRLIDKPELYPETLKDTLLYSESTGDFVPYRQLYFPLSYKNQWYQITVNQPTIEPDDLFYAVFASLASIFLLFILFSYLVGNFVQHKLWRPFYRLLDAAQSYELQQTSQLKLTDSGIVEFDELNHVINRMVAKIHADYINLKTFTEDASHEMQTPLSVIKSKIDILIQSDITNSDNIKAIQAMSNAVTRLSKLNRSLLLLAKINNNQFQTKETIHFATVIKSYLDDLAELIGAKNIKVNYRYNGDFNEEMSPQLADIVVSNLLSNAIRYCPENGEIKIVVNKNELVVANTSDPIDTSVNLFNRFGRHKDSKDSTGLGLSIIKSICDTHSLLAEYDYKNGIFSIKIGRG